MLSRQNSDGSFSTQLDITAYYKAPGAFAIAGKLSASYLALNFIKSRFLRENGDFGMHRTKSEDIHMREYCAYPNGWIVMNAHRLGRFDISLKGFKYILSYFNEESGGFCTNWPYGKRSNVVDIITTAHLGLVCLYLANLDKATRAADFLVRFIANQTRAKKYFYLRSQSNVLPITNFPETDAKFFVIDLSKSDQDYFHIGYPVAFLAKFFMITKKRKYLNAAKKYMDITTRCQKDVYASLNSGKVGWGASVLYSITGEKKYLNIVKQISDHIVKKQTKEGYWWMDTVFKSPRAQPMYCTLDMTAENIIWLSEFSLVMTRKSHIAQRN